jgi:heat shock 70kDa protein 1/2/6/8
MIGRRFSDKSVQEDITLWPFKVVAGREDRPMVVVEYKGEEKRFSPEEISAMVLAKMRETAEVYLGTSVKNAVVTIPVITINNPQVVDEIRVKKIHITHTNTMKSISF